MHAVRGQHPENVSTCREPVHAVNEIKKDAQSNVCTHGQGRGLQSSAWFRQWPHMAGRQREDKMFPTQASISPEPGEALSLSSRGGEGRRGDGQGGWVREMGRGVSHKTHGYDMMLTLHIYRDHQMMGLQKVHYSFMFQFPYISRPIFVFPRLKLIINKIKEANNTYTDQPQH